MALLPGSAKLIARDLAEIARNPIPGISVQSADSLECVEAVLAGPEDTPFAGGRFELRLRFGSGYPDAPPAGSFLTKIFHPNVSDRGEICVNTLKKDWRPELGLRHVLLVIRCLLIEPNPESALNEEAGRLLLEDYGEYCRRARIFTGIHAGGGAARPAPPQPGAGEAPRPLSAKQPNSHNSMPAPKVPGAKDRKKSLKRL